MIALLLGLAIGYYINQSQIKEIKQNHRERIYEYKEAFSKGFQTSNGHQPYLTEEVEPVSIHDPEPNVYEDEEDEEVTSMVRKRWDID